MKFDADWQTQRLLAVVLWGAAMAGVGFFDIWYQNRKRKQRGPRHGGSK